MRRPWATGAAIVMCLVLGGLPAAAQEQSLAAPPAPAVSVTGTISTICDLGAATDTIVDGVTQWRGLDVSCRETMSDPRVDGVNEHDYDRDCWFLPSEVAGEEAWIGCVERSDFVLTGPDGTWEGSDHGFLWADGGRDVHRVATGTGAYAGWTYLSHVDDDVVSGFIYQGELPPTWGAAAAVGE